MNRKTINKGQMEERDYDNISKQACDYFDGKKGHMSFDNSPRSNRSTHKQLQASSEFEKKRKKEKAFAILRNKARESTIEKKNKFIRKLVSDTENSLISKIKHQTTILIQKINEELKINMDSNIYHDIELLDDPVKALIQNKIEFSMPILTRIKDKYIKRKKLIISDLLELVFWLIRLAGLYNSLLSMKSYFKLVSSIPYNSIYSQQLVRIKDYIIGKIKHRLKSLKRNPKQKFTACQVDNSKRIFQHKIEKRFETIPLMNLVIIECSFEYQNNSIFYQLLFELILYFTRSNVGFNSDLFATHIYHRFETVDIPNDEERRKLLEYNSRLDHLLIETKMEEFVNDFQEQLYKLKIDSWYPFILYYRDKFMPLGNEQKKKQILEVINSEIIAKTRNSLHVLYKSILQSETKKISNFRVKFENYFHKQHILILHESISKKMRGIGKVSLLTQSTIEEYVQRSKYNILALLLLLINNNISAFQKAEPIERVSFSIDSDENRTSNKCFDFLFKNILSKKSNILMDLIEKTQFEGVNFSHLDSESYKFALYKIILTCFTVLLSIKKNKQFNSLIFHYNNSSENIFEGIIIRFES